MSFSILSIFIASMGLFVLTSFAVEIRRKEIGIGKILGASGRIILLNLYGDFNILIIIASVAGIPLAYLLMTNLDEKFCLPVGL